MICNHPFANPITRKLYSLSRLHQIYLRKTVGHEYVTATTEYIYSIGACYPRSKVYDGDRVTRCNGACCWHCPVSLCSKRGVRSNDLICAENTVSRIPVISYAATYWRSRCRTQPV